MRKRQKIGVTEEREVAVGAVEGGVRRADHQHAPWFEDATHFREKRFRIGDLLERVPDEHPIERMRLESALLERAVEGRVTVRASEMRRVMTDVDADRVPAPFAGDVRRVFPGRVVQVTVDAPGEKLPSQLLLPADAVRRGEYVKFGRAAVRASHACYHHSILMPHRTAERLSIEQLRLIGSAVEVSDLGIAILTPGGDTTVPQITFVNGGFCRMYGTTREAMTGKSLADFRIVEPHQSILDAILEP